MTYKEMQDTLTAIATARETIAFLESGLQQLKEGRLVPSVDIFAAGVMSGRFGETQSCIRAAVAKYLAAKKVALPVEAAVLFAIKEEKKLLQRLTETFNNNLLDEE